MGVNGVSLEASRLLCVVGGGRGEVVCNSSPKFNIDQAPDKLHRAKMAPHIFNTMILTLY